MRRLRRCLAQKIVACSLLQALACIAHANAPDGFRGMKWGDPVARLPNAIAVGNPSGCYGNRREELRLGSARLSSVLYCFEHDRLIRVELRTATGEDNLQAFEEAVIAVFGQPLPSAPGASRHVRHFTPPDAPVGVTLIREVLGVHKYLLVLESRRAQGDVDSETGEAKKDFGF